MEEVTPEFFKKKNFRKGVTIFRVNYLGRTEIGIYTDIVQAPGRTEWYLKLSDSGGGVGISLKKITAIKEIPLEEVVSALNEVLRFEISLKGITRFIE